MKKLSLLILIITLMSCKEQDPYLQLSFAKNTIPLESVDNYGALKDLIETLYCTDDSSNILYYHQLYNIKPNNTTYQHRQKYQIQLEAKNYYLPVYQLYCDQEFKLKMRNIFQIHHNTELKRKAIINFITNNGVNPKYSEKPTKATIAFRFEKQMQLETFEGIAIFLIETYHHLWREQSIKIYNKPFEELSNLKKESIIKDYPVNVILKTNTSF